LYAGDFFAFTIAVIHHLHQFEKLNLMEVQHSLQQGQSRESLAQMESKRREASAGIRS
jgi:hypothetical protein